MAGDDKEFWDKVESMEPVVHEDTIEDAEDVVAGTALGVGDVPGEGGLDVGAVGNATVRDADVVDPDRPMLPPETVEESDMENRAP